MYFYDLPPAGNNLHPQDQGSIILEHVVGVGRVLMPDTTDPRARFEIILAGQILTVYCDNPENEREQLVMTMLNNMG